MSATVTWIEESVLRGGVVAEAARPVSYMKVGKSRASQPWPSAGGGRAEMSSAEEAQVVMAEHRALAAAAQDRPLSRSAAFVIAILWAACVLLATWLCGRSFVS